MIYADVKPCKKCGHRLIWFEQTECGISGVCVTCGNGVFNFDTLEDAVNGWNNVNTEVTDGQSKT